LGRKESCPVCSSKKIIMNHEGNKECKVCKHKWQSRTKRKTTKKGKVRFR